jgi:hypothetical protein
MIAKDMPCLDLRLNWIRRLAVIFQYLNHGDLPEEYPGRSTCAALHHPGHKIQDLVLQSDLLVMQSDVTPLSVELRPRKVRLGGSVYRLFFITRRRAYLTSDSSIRVD